MNIPKFKNQELFEQVFTHRSYLNEAGKVMESNETLEFLGDSILSFVVSSFIYKKYPTFKEGELTNLRSALTNTESLYKIADNLNLGENLRLSKGERMGGGRSNKTILADTFEALIGGLYIDQGITEVRKFIEKVLLGESQLSSLNMKDSKSKLQELVQKEYRTSPSYKTLKEEGPDHAKLYTVGVYFNDKQVGEGQGHSKQEAEKLAAQNALIKIEKVDSD